MFEGMTERRIARAADKVIALKEDIDSLSWGRVFDIGKRLQELGLGEEATDLAHELIGIARSNISLEAKLGIAPSASGKETLASGMPAPSASSSFATGTPIAGEPSAFAAGAAAVNGTCAMETASEPIASIARMTSAAGAERRIGETGAAHPTSAAAENDDSLEEELALFFENPAEPASISVEAQASCPVSVETEASCPAPIEAEASCFVSAEAETSGLVSAEIATPVPANVVPVKPVANEPDVPAERQQAPVKQEGRHVRSAVAEGHGSDRKSEWKKFATFRSLYSSRDGGLCLYEDESGHLVAVDSSKLA